MSTGNMIKSAIIAIIFVAVAIGVVFAVAEILYQAEWRQEQVDNEKEHEEDYKAAVQRNKIATRWRKIFDFGVTKREVQALLAEFFDNNYPSTRVERNQTSDALYWNRGSGQWFVVIEALLGRLNPQLTHASITTQLAEYAIRVCGTTMAAIVVGSMAACIFWLFESISSPLFGFGRIPHRLTYQYQSKLITRDGIVLALSVAYMAAAITTCTFSISHRLEMTKTDALLSMIFRMTSTYHSVYANDSSRGFSTGLSIYLTATSLLLISAHAIVFFSVMRLYRTWRDSDYYIMESSEFQKLLDEEQSERTNHQQYYSKQE